MDRVEVPGDAGGSSDGTTLITGHGDTEARSSNRPIGVFDSGVGGLSVLREIRRELPHEDVVYVADSGHAPYGDQSRDFIERRAAAILSFFIEQHAKAVVVACNTATGMAVDALRSQFSLPIVAIVLLYR